MPSAHVVNRDAIAELKSGLRRYGGETNETLLAVDRHTERALDWLHTVVTHRARARDDREDELRQARAALGECREESDSCESEEDDVHEARWRVRAAEDDLAEARDSLRRVNTAADSYRAQAARMRRTVALDLPQADAHLAGVLQDIERYLSAAPASAELDAQPAPVSVPRSSVQSSAAAEGGRTLSQAEQRRVTRVYSALRNDFGDRVGRVGDVRNLQNIVIFQDHETFVRAWQTSGSVDIPLAYYDPTLPRIYVDRSRSGQDLTLVHEALHYYGNGALGDHAGAMLNEGVAEYLALSTVRRGAVSDKGPLCYVKVRELVEHLVTITGEEPLRAAYFDGDVETLAQTLDDRLGPDAFSQFAGHVEAGRYGAAGAVLGSGPSPSRSHDR